MELAIECRRLKDLSLLTRGGSGGGDGIAPVTPPTPPDVPFSASGGWKQRNSSDTGHASPVMSPSRWLSGLHPLAFARLGDGDRSSRVPKSRLFSLPSLVSCTVSPFLSALRSSRLSAFVFATTASADFSLSLNKEISPGKNLSFLRVPSGSTWCVLMSLGLRVC
jgi:hypothetical protein